MKHSEFTNGKEFFTSTGRWLCTDKGKRTVIAIKKDKTNSSWYKGPPYAVPEIVFDEDDIFACIATYAKAKKEWGAKFDQSVTK